MPAAFVVTPAEREELLARDPRNAQFIRPFLGGAELNAWPTLTADRCIIDFGETTLDGPSAWPDLLTRLEELVKPQRATVTQRDRRELWWLFATRAPAARQFVETHGRILATAYTSAHSAFAFCRTRIDADRRARPVPLRCVEHIRCTSVACSREMGAATVGVDEGRPPLRSLRLLRDLPFPKPAPRAEIPALEAIGKELYDARAAFMVDTDQGLTKTYNALKDSAITERSGHGARIAHLRALHLAMDRAVLEAYATETADPTWLDVELPPFTTPETPAEKDLHQRFEDHVLDKLFELNARRAQR